MDIAECPLALNKLEMACKKRHLNCKNKKQLAKPFKYLKKKPPRAIYVVDFQISCQNAVR